MKHHFLVFASLFATYSIAQQSPVSYPKTAKGQQIDDYFGEKVTDPYRWLEDDNSKETKAWVEEENKLTFDYLSKIPFRENIRKRIGELYNFPRTSAPYKAGKRYFFTKNDGLQNQAIIYNLVSFDDAPNVFLDPNKMSKDGTAAVALAGFSTKRDKVAYTVSQSGSDWQAMYVMDVENKKLMADSLKWIKFSGAAWYKNGFYYSAFDAPKKGEELSKANSGQKIYYHKMGEPQAKDVLTYSDPENPKRYLGAQVTDDESFLILNLSEGTSGNEIRAQRFADGQKAGEPHFKTICKGFDFEFDVLDNDGDFLIVHTNYNAPNYKVVLIDFNKSDVSNWKDIVPERKERLQSVSVAAGQLFCFYIKDATSKVEQYSRTGSLVREIELPGLGTVSGFSGEKDDKFLFYSFTSFTTPSTIYKYDIASGKSEVWLKPELKYNPDDYETKQVFYPSKDGTQVPMFLVYKKGLELNGQNATMLYAYGGFNISLTPNFNPSRMVLLESGGIFAMANLRGGGEYGETWHKGGMLEKKQNVFDDFISAAEYLIKNQYTNPDKLAISGRSNGGLLVGATMVQRPDLFKVCFPSVGVLDMYRYHKFTVGWGWAVEYGSSDNKEQFQTLKTYSPLHNLKPANYPATLITTADHDDRVVPAHSFKFAATLQENQTGKAPTLIRVDVKAGHGGGRPLSKTIDEDTDIYSFMLYNMEVGER